MKYLLLDCVDLIPRKVHTMSLTRREEFAQVSESLGFYLDKIAKDPANSTMTYSKLYDTDEKFRHYCKTLLQLAGVNPDWVDLDLMCNLLFPFTDEDNRVHKRGLLLEFNFDESTDGKGESMSYEELLALVWNAADSLVAAKEAAETIPLDVIVNAIIAKADQMRPAKERLQEKGKKRAQADIEAFRAGELELNLDHIQFDE